MKFSKLILPAVVLAAIAGAGYYFFAADSSDSQVHYITEPVTRGTLDKNVLATGTVRANQRTEVGAQVSGKLEKILVSLGDRVSAGQTLAEIDSTTQRNTLNTAQAQLAIYQAQLKSQQVALDVAQSAYTRLSKLYSQKSTTLDELNTAKSTLSAAQSTVDQTKAQIHMAEISVNTAQTDLSYTKITSPIDGVVVSIPVSVGQTMNANQTTPTIMQVADVDKVLIKLEIAEGDIQQVKAGQEVSFTTLSAPNKAYRGTIAKVDPALTTLTDDSYTEASGSSDAVYYYANVQMDNPDNVLRIGMTAQGRISISKKDDVLLVPTSALQKRGPQTIIPILENGKMVEKTIEIGIADSTNTEVVSGLNEGELVITTQRSETEKVGNSGSSRGGPPGF